MRKLKILQVATPFIEVRKDKITSGVTNVTRLITNNMVDLGHDVSIFAPKGSKTKAKFVQSTGRAYDNFKLVTPYQNDLLHIFSVLSCAVSYAQKNKFDIVHNHINLVAPVVYQTADIPIVSTLHFTGFNPTQQDYFRKTPYPYYVAISDYAYKHHPFLKFIGRVYNGIDINNFQFNSNGGNKLIWLAGICRRKGTVEAIKAARLAGIPIDIWGKNRDEKYFVKEVKPLLDGKKYIYRGPVSSLKHRSKVLGDAKAYLFPIQWDEPFGLTMIEAMACGTPVIAFRRGSVPEIVDKKTGHIVRNVREMAGRVKDIDKIKRKDCRKRVEKHFTVERMVENYEKIYNKVIRDFKKHN